MATLCRAVLNYFDPSLMAARPVDQAIADGRRFDNPGWQVSGFELIQHSSAVTDWSDEAQLTSIHYPEIAALARSLSGADEVLLGSHILRNPEQAAVHEDLGPIQFAHSDFAASYHDRLIAFYAGNTPEAAASLGGTLKASDVARARRLLILQFWRNVGANVMDLPLAFCDARTVPAEEVLPAPVQDYAGGGFDFETLAILPARAGEHAWYTFPAMQVDEVVAFRTYDSARVGTDQPFWTPHSAYRDPAVALGAPSRYSIELRATCLWF